MKKFTFRGGIHPEENKRLSEEKPIEEVPLPKEVYVPLQQHIGAPLTSLVKIGDIVKTGQKIGDSEKFISAPVHASISGEVRAIAEWPHPVLGKYKAVVIESDGKDEWIDTSQGEDYTKMRKEDIIKITREAGIVGLGGAAFPTFVKLTPIENKKIDTFILNAAECEPYLTIDYRNLLENAADIITGMKIIMQVLEVKKGIIGIEENKMKAIDKLKEYLKDEEIEIKVLKTKYPQGGEKQLINAILKRTVPSGGLPLDVGVVVNNVGTAIAVKEAVCDNKSLIERSMTITGEGIKEPKNLKVRIGTSLSYLIDYCGGFYKEVNKVIMGGPMMGITVSSLDAPVIKGTSGLLVFAKENIKENGSYPCISCGRCIESCPISLLPCMLTELAQGDRFEETKENGLLDCIECGSCAYGCPAKIEIVHWIKYAKLRVRQ
jgi:electron transport complex protein RnfC